jgi:hypothetical protein
LQTGLLAAVVTPFLTDALKDVKANNASSSPTNPTTASPPNSHPSNSVIAIVSLWYSSLLICLILALCCVWAKLWVQNLVTKGKKKYTSARIRDTRDIHTVADNTIRALAVIMHIAVLTFAAGLITFAWTKLDTRVPGIVTVICLAIGLGLYGWSNDLRKGAFWRVWN